VTALAALALAVAPHVAATDIASIQPVKGLVLTSTVHSTFVVSGGGGADRSYSGTDVEQWDSVVDATAEALVYQLRVSAPADAQENADLAKFVIQRSVRREDIVRATRINLFYSSVDPQMFAGQTFEETSVKGVAMLKSGAEVPYVIGVIDGEDPMGGIGAMMQQVAKQSAGAKPGGSPLSGMASLFTSGHTYYRGTLKRVEAEPVMLPVLLDGVRVSLPAVHAQGTITNGDKAIQAQFWWLDSAVWPVTLEWSLTRDSHKASQQVTKIDRPPPDTGPNFGGIAEALQKSCHVELSGIYFNTGSAVLLPESQPALRNIAQAVLQSKQPVLDIEGHTDNVGTAQLNQDLSQKRAQAVRQSLVAQFGVPPGRLTATGFGFAHPVESNDTVEGRARNRRVELACAASH
jgi:outer membrane protein OmpA-like peptidoglycan-associated protein